jgi:hypothetical protein
MLGVLRQQDVTPGPARTSPAAPGQGPPGASGPAGSDPAPRPAPLAPAPGLAGLDRLIERTRGAGLRVTLEVSGMPRPAPAGVDLSAYRIIQEALTNVVRHAGTGARCVVSVGYTDSDLVIRVTDDGGLPVALPSVTVAAQGTGHGIIGMRERVHLCGGTFTAGPRPDGGFQVTAALPLPAVGLRAAVGGGTEDRATAAQVPLPAGPPAAVRPAVPPAQPTAVAGNGPPGTGDSPAGAGNGPSGTADVARAPLGAVAGNGGGRG